MKKTKIEKIVSIVAVAKDNFAKHPKSISKLIEKRSDISKILLLLGMTMNDYKCFTFESCSLILALNDKKTLIEICFSPEIITSWEESRNPLFQHFKL